jgi:hypothetical protein
VWLTEAAADRLDEGEWSTFLTVHQVMVGPRFLQSVKWGNEDRDSLILGVIKRLFEQAMTRRYSTCSNAILCSAGSSRSSLNFWNSGRVRGSTFRVGLPLLCEARA